mgnify:FL=1
MLSFNERARLNGIKEGDLLSSSTLIASETPGTFTITVDDRLIWDRKVDGGFPEIKELKARVKTIVGDVDLGHSDLKSTDLKDDIRGMGRRRSLSKIATSSAIAAASACLSLVAATKPAFADVSDGNTLPEGMKQFGNILVYKKEWSKVSKSLRENADLTKEEWKSLSLGLRRFYTCADDMRLVSSGFGASKNSEATEIIESFRKNVKETDKLIGDDTKKDRDIDAIIASNDKSISLLDKFLDLLNDVPDL